MEESGVCLLAASEFVWGPVACCVLHHLLTYSLLENLTDAGSEAKSGESFGYKSDEGRRRGVMRMCGG